jgi:hypothetical protein
LNFGQAVANGALDDGRGKLDLFVFGQAGRFAEPVNQRALFRLGGGQPAGILLGLFGLTESGLLLDILC